MLYNLGFLSMLVLLACNTGTNTQPERWPDQASELDSRALNLVLYGEEDSILLALDLWTEVLRMEPDHLGALYNKLVWQHELGMFKGSHYLYERIETLTPNDPWIKSGHGAMLEYFGDSAGAHKKYLQADSIYTIHLRDNSMEPLSRSLFMVNHASNLKLLRREVEANAILDDILTNDPDPALVELLTKQRKASREDLFKKFQERAH